MAEANSAALLVVAQNAARSFGRGAAKVVALQPTSCQVSAGERIAVVGPSGSGKSTLLQLLAGLDTPSAGAVSWPALGSREKLRPQQVAFVFQAPSLLAPLNALENVETPLLLGGMDPAKARQAAEQALRQLQLSALAAKLPEELSGGQAQRVAMARALATQPRLIFADEPTGQLDHDNAAALLDTLLAAIMQSGAALVVATHDPSVAARLDITWQMRYGVLENS